MCNDCGVLERKECQIPVRVILNESALRRHVLAAPQSDHKSGMPLCPMSVSCEPRGFDICSRSASSAYRGSGVYKY